MMLSTIPVQQPHQAPPVGGVLRILLGLVLMIYVTPVYFHVPARVTVASLLLTLGLIGVYSLIHIVVSRLIVRFGPCAGAVIGLALLVALYFAGGSRSPIFGHGQGSTRSSHVSRYLVSGCWSTRRPRLRTLMAIPGALFGNDTELACLIFSPLDSLERKLRTKHDA